MPSPTTAWFLTFGTYGSRLHGDSRGSVDRNHASRDLPHLPRDDFRANFERRLMVAPAFEIDGPMRTALEATFGEVCEHRMWTLLALNIRIEHVHIVVAAECAPEQVLGTFKSYGTHALRQAGMISDAAHVWARHGSTRPLRDEAAIAAAIDYTANRQGDDLPGAGALHRLGRRAGDE